MAQRGIKRSDKSLLTQWADRLEAKTEAECGKSQVHWYDTNSIVSAITYPSEYAYAYADWCVIPIVLALQ